MYYTDTKKLHVLILYPESSTMLDGLFGFVSFAATRCGCAWLKIFLTETWYHNIQFTPALKSKEILMKSPQS